MLTPSVPPQPTTARARLRRSRLGIALVVLWRAMRGLPLGMDGDPPELQRAAKAVTAAVYNILSRRLGRSDTDFMNYGYQPLAPGQEGASEGTPHAGDHLCANLYRRVATAADLRDKDALEIGCGRGGGAALVARELHPRSMVGVDLSAAAVAHCRATHHEPNLRFFKADAEDLPFVAGSFDAVINVESSHGYPSMLQFLSEAHRVLRPEGVLLFADVRAPVEMKLLREQFSSAGFAILEEERVTPNVVRALELDKTRRLAIANTFPRPLRRIAGTFVGAESGEIYGSLRNAQLEYFRFVLRREPSPSDTGSQTRLGAVPAG